MAQAIHSAFGFANTYPTATSEWLRESQFLVVVNVPDEAALLALSQTAAALGVPQFLWHEPDQADEATAVALAPVPESMRLCSSLPLAGKALAKV
jgi:peptidyl-tRNA hydrolase